MNTTHIHLLLNHFPIIGTLIGSCLLLWGIITKQDSTKSIAAAVLVVMTLIAIPVFLTGEPAEESVEKLAGVSENAISMHEEAAEIAIWLIGMTGIVALAALFMAWQRRKMINSFFVLAFVLSAICFAAMARTGYLGGQIRHTEIQNGNTSGEQVDKEKDNEKENKEDKDND